MKKEFLEGLTIHDTFDENARGLLSVDIQKYEEYLQETDMTEAEKKAFLEALWSIVNTFVDLGFGVHPLQLVEEILENSSTDSLKDVFSKENDADLAKSTVQIEIINTFENT